MGRPVGVQELARGFQGGALRFIKARWEAHPQPFSAMFEELWEEDKIACARIIQGIMPKELLVQVEQEHNVNLNLSPELLQDAIALERRRRESGADVVALPESVPVAPAGGTTGGGVLLEG